MAEHEHPGGHSAEHEHAHGHGHRHGHGVSAEADRRCLTGAPALIVGFMAVEVVVGLIARSLALISDAGHMLADADADAIAIGFALIAMRIAARPPKGGFTYGLERAEIISAQINGITLRAASRDREGRATNACPVRILGRVRRQAFAAPRRKSRDATVRGHWPHTEISWLEQVRAAAGRASADRRGVIR